MDRNQFLASSAYLVAGVLFILSLRGLSSQQTARRGNLYGIIGMAIAILATLSVATHPPHPLLLAAIGGGAVIGAIMAIRVGMTQMPEMVALLHSFVGIAAVLVGYATALPFVTHAEAMPGGGHGSLTKLFVEVYIDVWIGA